MSESIRSFGRHVNRYNGQPGTPSRPVSQLGYDGMYLPRFRPIVGGGAGGHSIRAYLLDRENPAVETELSGSAPDGVAFGVSTTKRKDIVFLVDPGLLEGEEWDTANYMLSVRIDWETTNEGGEPAIVTTRIGLREFDNKWLDGLVCWDTRPTQYDGYAIGSNVVLEGAGDNLPDTASIVSGGGYSPTFELTREFDGELASAEESLPWSGCLTGVLLPDAGWILSAYGSSRVWRVAGEQTTDAKVEVSCKYYGYKLEVEI